VKDSKTRASKSRTGPPNTWVIAPCGTKAQNVLGLIVANEFRVAGLDRRGACILELSALAEETGPVNAHAAHDSTTANRINMVRTGHTVRLFATTCSGRRIRGGVDALHRADPHPRDEAMGV
jgi:hypothetical protein